MVWIALTERILLEEEMDEEDEEDEDEGGSGRGEGVTKEDDVGWEWKDITNLGKRGKQHKSTIAIWDSERNVSNEVWEATVDSLYL